MSQLGPFTAKIVQCELNGPPFQTSNGAMRYYHKVTLDDLSSIIIDYSKEMPAQLSNGSTIIYTINNDDPNRLKYKLVKSSSDGNATQNTGASKPATTGATKPNYPASARNNAKTKNNNQGGGSSRYMKDINNPNEYLGYCYSYAKDMVTAGKTTPKDILDLTSIAHQLYNHISLILKESQSNAIDSSAQNEPSNLGAGIGAFNNESSKDDPF